VIRGDDLLRQRGSGSPSSLAIGRASIRAGAGKPVRFQGGLSTLRCAALVGSGGWSSLLREAARVRRIPLDRSPRRSSLRASGSDAARVVVVFAFGDACVGRVAGDKR
jgi:hypothetical protein